MVEALTYVHLENAIRAIRSSYDSDDQNNLIRDADEMLQGVYRFNNQWDMERCDTPYELLHSKSYYTPNNDPEWVYSYARMEHLHKLILAYLLTSDDKYIKCYLKTISLFFRQNNEWNSAYSYGAYWSRGVRKVNRIMRKKIGLPEVQSTYRTLDTAIRNFSLSIDLLYLGCLDVTDPICGEIGFKD